MSDEKPLVLHDLDDESVEWLIEAARHHRPGGYGHVADELRRALCDRREGNQVVVSVKGDADVTVKWVEP